MASESKSKKRAAGEAPEVEDDSQYRRGSIYRVKMVNFLTYTDVEVFPGPRLNLVVGPNGTGKSSIVCAICLGLAGSTKSLGRAENPKDYVKKGCESGYIEIELFEADEGKDYVSNITVTRGLFLDNSSVWKLNGKKSTEKEVKALTKRLNIQVDNRCAFLAQDRVQAFARMKPPELLTETQVSINPKLVEQHNMLIKLGKRTKQSAQELKNLEQNLVQVQDQVASIKEVVDRVRQREELLKKVDQLKKKKLWAEFEVARDVALASAQAKDAAEAELNDEKAKQEPLQQKLEACKAEVVRRDEEYKAAFAAFAKLDGQRKELGDETDNLETKVNDLYAEMESVKSRAEERAKRLQKLEKGVVDYKRKYENLPEVDELERKVADSRTQGEKLRVEKGVFDDEVRGLRSQRDEIDTQMRKLRSKINDVKNVKERRLEEVEKSNNWPKLKEMWKWVQDNKAKFEGPVFGPLFLEVEVKDQLAAKQLDSQLALLKFAFITRTKNDWNLLSETQRQQHFPRVQIICVDKPIQQSHPRLYGDDSEMKELRNLGIEGFLDEVMKCDPTVMQAIIDFQNSNYAAYSRRDINVERVLAWRSRIRGSSIRVLYTPSQYYTSTTATHGTKDRSDRVEKLNDAKVFVVRDNSSEVDSMERELKQLDREKEDLEKKIKDVLNKSAYIPLELEKLSKLRSECADEIKKKKTAKKQWEQAEKDLNEAKRESGDNDEKELAILRKQVSKINQKRMEIIRQLRDVIRDWTRSSQVRDAHAFELIRAKAIQNHVQAQIESVSHQFKKFQDKYNKALEDHKKNVGQTKRLKAIADKEAPLGEYQEIFKEEWMPDTVDEIETRAAEYQAQAEAGMIDDPDALRRYHERQQAMEDLQATLASSSSNHERDMKEISAVKDEWLPELQKAVGVISQQFSAYYKDMKCTGEVKLGIADDFEEYGLQIFVSYREGTAMKLLSGESQSGGEKSVATMLFLLCLQKVTDCPFRVVDEINQGMDPNNERIIFNQLSRSTLKAHTPQYFLITPKLLPRLEYTESITILFICNGPWMCKQDVWNMKKFKDKAKKKRRIDPPDSS